MQHKVIIRKENTSDHAVISDVVKQAFANHPHSIQNEHHIIDRLRETDKLSLLLVACEEGNVVGCVAFSPVSITEAESHSNAQHDSHWCGLGPVAVLPEKQGCGIGSKLIQMGLYEMKQKSIAGCVLAGDPGFYGRFGFIPDSGLQCDGIPPEFFLSLLWQGNMPNGQVSYCSAFNTEH